MLDAARDLIREFLKLESASGLLLIAAAVLALLAANSPLAGWYALLIDVPVGVRVGALAIDKPLLLWINDGLMAVFFLLIGLELKREFVTGELKNPENLYLPATGALGGIAGPALIYLAFNAADPVAIEGWAIPVATDIAFALGVLTLLGSSIPHSLKVFLVTLAIFDDLGAIAIIALFYTNHLALAPLVIAGVCIAALWILNRRREDSLGIYLAIGAVVWIALLKSGVHATLSGVITALFIPLRPDTTGDAPLIRLERDLHPVVAYVILPVFAFANAGVELHGMSAAELLHPVPVGVALGLFIGKPLGVFGLCWVAVRLRIASLSAGMSWASLWGVALLTGVGFTMSLFIGSLAFEETGVNRLFDERIGILLGSLLSGLTGYAILRRIFRPDEARP